MHFLEVMFINFGQQLQNALNKYNMLLSQLREKVAKSYEQWSAAQLRNTIFDQLVRQEH